MRAHLLSKGASNLYIGVLQIDLYAHKISLADGIDCGFRTSTEYGLISFQKSVGISTNNIAGKNTFVKLAGE